jgi:MYXO-CTERM domain-containing protein
MRTTFTSGTVFCAVLAAAASVTSVARADMAPVGDPFPHGSWGQQWVENGVGNFDHVQFFMISGATQFDTPTALQGFSASWSQTYNDGNVAVMDGNAVNELYWSHIYTGDQSTPFSYCFEAYSNGVMVDSVVINWVPNVGWTFDAKTASHGFVVPTPGAAALMGLGALASKRRRRA